MEKKVKSILLANGSNPLRKSEIINEYKVTCKRNLAEDVKAAGFKDTNAFFEQYFSVDQNNFVGLKPSEDDSAAKVKHITELLLNKKPKENYDGFGRNKRPQSTQSIPQRRPENLPRRKKSPPSGFSSNLVPLGGGSGSVFKKANENARDFFAPNEPQPSSSQPSRYTDHTADQFFYEEDLDDDFSVLAVDDVSEVNQSEGRPDSRDTSMSMLDDRQLNEETESKSSFIEIKQNTAEIYLRIFEDFLNAVLEKARTNEGLSRETLYCLTKEFGISEVINWDNIDATLAYFKEAQTTKEAGVIFIEEESESNFVSAVEKLGMINPAEDLSAREEECVICERNADFAVLQPIKWAKQWASFNRELFQYLCYTKPTKATFIQTGHHYLCANSDQTYFRGQVLSVDPNGNCRVLGIDLGKDEVIAADSIFQMPAHFYNFHPMVVFFRPDTPMRANGTALVNFQRYEYIKDRQVYYGDFIHLH
ncbi:unnamed protein product [Bursaphelenchus xylophilus]|uniref:(pine wood nematode) hypothetical protein n=1 Tax=Bursaphelenchus xylophilus TaxID=6326 RepID=A0A1I7RSB2_BURXY|nr:unnamed protein product [Bursaphelenchus xylophilus]CAG9123074.1 unnamed protein product [Bursaphelenchus xylophilus]